MDQSPCKLTLVYPPVSEDCIVELMLNAEPPLSGFTTLTADGHGHDFGDATIHERVRGRIQRGILTVVLPRSRLAALLENIRLNAAIDGLTYWVEPVDAFGRLTSVKQMADAKAAA